MNAQQLIDAYVEDVAKRLPRKLRNDVARELRALLNEELHVKANAAGRAPDESMALQFLRGFGHPRDVAARYRPGVPLINPTDTADFLWWAVVGSLAVVALGLMPWAQPPKHGQEVGVLSWLGILVVFFGIKGWAQRRSPEKYRWKPRDKDQVSRAGFAALAVVIVLGIVCFGEPAWVFEQVSGGLTLPPWLAYAEGFQATRLPWLLALWGLSAVLYTIVAFEGHWRPPTQQIEIVLNSATAGVLTWFLVGGQICHTAVVNNSAKAGVAVAIVLIAIDTVVKIYRMTHRTLPAPA